MLLPSSLKTVERRKREAAHHYSVCRGQQKSSPVEIESAIAAIRVVKVPILDHHIIWANTNAT